MAILSIASNNVAPFAVAFGTIASVYLVYLVFIRPLRSPLAKFPGPKSQHWLFGNLLAVHRSQTGSAHEAWSKDFGPVVAYRGFGGEMRVFFSDPRAINHVLVTQSYNYPKPEATRGELRKILGNGVLFAEGDDHKRTRRVLQPSFSAAQVTVLLPTFYAAAQKLRSRWTDIIRKEAGKPSGQDYVVLDVSTWLSKATLDIIGKAGFDFDFGSLDDETHVLASAFQQLQAAGEGMMTIFDILIFFLGRSRLPGAKLIRTKRSRVMANCLKTMERESRKMLADKKEAVLREMRGEKVAGAKGQLEGKDLMSVLVKANISSDAKTRLSDEELVPQMTTFMLAGHETTATAATWLLWELAKRPDVQTRLRNEIRGAIANARERGESELSVDEIQSLPYLEAVTREILRFQPPVPGTLRQSNIDDSIPLSQPVTLKDGTVADHVPVRKGDKIMITIGVFNRYKPLFGEDADEFRPERWLNKDGPPLGGAGVYAGMLSFLAGPRGCIGYRFAVLELKVLVIELLANFAFAERDEGGGPAIERNSMIVMKPRVRGEKMSRMPLRVSLVS